MPKRTPIGKELPEMNPSPAVDILDELLAAESRSLIRHLGSLNVFISWASADDAEAVQAMVVEDAQHADLLTKTILELNGNPSPLGYDPAAAGMHYLELHTLLPQVVAGEELLVARYEDSVGTVADEPAAAEVVARLLARHRSRADRLRTLAITRQPSRESGHATQTPG